MLLPKRTRRPQTSTEATTSKTDRAIKINGCEFEGTVLDELISWTASSNPETAVEKLSTVLQKLNITGNISLAGISPITLFEGEKVVKLFHAGSKLTDFRYPRISILEGNEEITYSVNEGELQMEVITKNSDNGYLDFFFPTVDNTFHPLIEIRKGDWILNVDTSDGNSSLSRIPSLEEKLLSLDLTEKLTPSEVYKILSSFYTIPLSIWLTWTDNLHISTLWRVSIVDGKCMFYRKAHLSEENGELDIVWEIDEQEKSFRYQTNTVDYTLRKGKFTFETSSTSYENVFNSCKAEIAIFREEMKHILD